ALTRAHLSRCVATARRKFLSKFLDRRPPLLAWHTVRRSGIAAYSGVETLETRCAGKLRYLQYGAARLRVSYPRMSGHRAGSVGGSQRLFAIHPGSPYCRIDLRRRVLR